MSTRAAPFRIYAAVGLIGFLLSPNPAQAQANALREQAMDIAKNEFSKSWLYHGNQWFLYFEVPQNSFTQVLGQQGTARGYAQAVEITPTNAAEKQINEADLANGLQWQEQVTFVATRARVYNFASGWTQWESKPLVMTIAVENRNNQWSVRSAYNLGLPDYATYRRPEPNELPAEGEGPRAGPSTPGQQSHDCAIACQPSDMFCSSVKQKMTELSACGGPGTDVNLYNRFNDAGWFYCSKKQGGPDAAIRDFEAIRPSPSAVITQLDSFAIGAASQYRCR